MDLREILDEWKVDSKLNVSDLANEGARIYDLHIKYLDLWSYEKAALRKLENEYRKLSVEATEFYLYGLANKKSFSLWKPEDHPGLKILPTGVEKYVKADKHIQYLQDIIDQAEIKADALKSIMGMIQYRSNNIASIIEIIKYEGGS